MDYGRGKKGVVFGILSCVVAKASNSFRGCYSSSKGGTVQGHWYRFFSPPLTKTGLRCGLIIEFFFPVSFRDENLDLPAKGKYATGIVYTDKQNHQDGEKLFGEIAKECKLRVRLISIVVVAHRAANEPFVHYRMYL